MSEEVVPTFDRSAYNKKYYEENKAKHLKYCAEKIVCAGCGATHTRSTKSNHLKSKKHAEGLKFFKENKNKDYEKLEKKYAKMKKIVNRLLQE